LIALVKPVDAIKVHPRTGLSLGLPEVSVPYGALIEYVGSDRDREKFTYLGDLYTCRHDAYVSATGSKPASKPADEPAPVAEKAPEPVIDAGPRLEWEPLASSVYTVRRAAIPGGWLVALQGNGVTFVPDAKHEWDGASVE
jgi:hypothetical protein